MLINELPHWAIDQLEEHKPEIIDDTTAIARLAVDNHPREGFIIRFNSGAKAIQVQEDLSRPVAIWAQDPFSGD